MSTTDFGSSDKQAVACALGILGATSFALSTFVSMSSMLTGTFPGKEDIFWTKIPPTSFLIPSLDKCKFALSGDKVNELVQRAKNAHRNHTENVALLVCCYGIYMLSAADSPSARRMIVNSALLRVVYGPLYITAQAPWRTLVHLGAQIMGLSVMWIGVQTIFWE